MSVESDDEFTAAGPLLVKSLTSDAWEKWCKDGVVCFGYTSRDYDNLLKIYLANPKDQSVYHVIDLDFGQNDSPQFILIGSRIYVLLGCRRDGPVDARHCDLRQPLPDGGFEWKLGPKLNSHKHRPLLFSLSGNLYLLSTRSFELLKPDSEKWQVLPCPEYLSNEYYICGSLVFEDGNNNSKFLFQSYKITERAKLLHSFVIYDAQFNIWSRLVKPTDSRYDEPYCYLEISNMFGVDDIGLLLRQRSHSCSFVLSPHDKIFKRCLLEPMGFDLKSLFGKRTKTIQSRHLLPFGTSGFCFITLYTADDDVRIPYDSGTVRIATCESLQQSDQSKRAKTNDVSKYSYICHNCGHLCRESESYKLKTIDVSHQDVLRPLMFLQLQYIRALMNCR